MRVESKFLENKKWLVRKDIQDDYLNDSLLTDETVVVKGECLEITKSRQWSTSGLLILDTEMFFTSAETDVFKIEGECVVMDFMYNNNVKAEVDNMQNPDYRNLNTHNIWYTSKFRGSYNMPAFHKIKYMLFILSKEFYQYIFSMGTTIHPEFSWNIENEKASYLSPKYLPFSPAIEWVLYEIRNCQRTGLFKRIYMETKIKELVLLQLEMHTKKISQTTPVLHQSELDKLQQAKVILDNGFINPPSLIELSREISLNEFKLKKGFKLCFGDTVRSYIIKLRMNHARKLLKSQQTSVSEVAYECGYKDVSHFSAAFKAFYGLSPKSFMTVKNITRLLFYGMLSNGGVCVWTNINYILIYS